MKLKKKIQNSISILFSLVVLLSVTSCTSQGVTFVNQTNEEEHVSTVKETWLIDIGFEGGTGKAYIESPVQVTSVDGDLSAVFVWSSVNYDYMIVNGEKYLPVNETGNSVFEIPVEVFDFGLPVLADTTAMSTPHEVAYTLYFHSSTVTALS